MADLVYMLNTLVDKDGKILINDIQEDVAPLQSDEEELYKKIEFQVGHYRNSVGTKCLAHKEDKVKLLMHRWRYPSLSIHGIEGAFSEPGAKTVIPGKVVGKFSIRIVPNQTPEKVEKIVVSYLEKKWAERGSTNIMKVRRLMMMMCRRFIINISSYCRHTWVTVENRGPRILTIPII